MVTCAANIALVKVAGTTAYTVQQQQQPSLAVRHTILMESRSNLLSAMQNAKASGSKNLATVIVYRLMKMS